MDAIAARFARGKVIEVWFQDEARVGQKNRLNEPAIAGVSG